MLYSISVQILRPKCVVLWAMQKTINKDFGAGE
jgi:hypothetical protein